MLKIERYVYERLENVQGIPQFYGFTVEGNYNILAIELLGNSLHNIVADRGPLSLSIVLSLAEQMVTSKIIGRFVA